jgi:hypothetical protein
MNRKQLRRAICGSAILLTLGGGLLSQASGEGFISRLWDKRPKLSESRLNPRNWFGDDSSDKVADADLKPVVSVRPELNRNPFGGEPSFEDTGGAKTAAAPAGQTVAATSQQKQQAATEPAAKQMPEQASTAAGENSTLPVIAPAKTHAQATARTEQPAPSIDSIFHRPSPEMIEQARRRKLGGSVAAKPDAETRSDAQVANNEAAGTGVTSEGDAAAGKSPQRNTLMQMFVEARQEPKVAEPAAKPVAKPAAEPVAGRVALGSLAGGEAEISTNKGHVRLEDSGQVESRQEPVAEPTVSESDAAFNQLLAQIKGTASESGSSTVSSLAAPRLPDGLSVNSSAESAASAAADAQAEPTDAASPKARSQSIDEMIARTRAEMNATALARQAERERESVVGGGAVETRVDQVSVSQLGGGGSETATPLMIPQGLNPGSFRTYGEATAADRSSQSFPTAIRREESRSIDASNPQAASESGLSRIEQAARSAQQRASGPAIVPGQAGSGVVIDGKQYSVVRPKVTSNAAPSLSVPDNSTFRRLSYERRADDLAGQVERLADAGSTEPTLIAPGEPLPQADAPAEPTQNEASTQAATVATTGSQIDWPDEADLAPMKPKSGGTSWGFIIFCLTLLTAGSHIAVSRLRQSRMAAAAGKS